ncbi:nuclear transport factor 2 family protein [soil metagenome]
MTEQTKLIEQFYAAFARRDGDAMAACYADDVRFADPVFPKLEGDHARAMWKMLCGRAKDLTVTASDVSWDGSEGHAKWVAHYTFAATGRKVENIIQATFKIAGGKIVEHQDVFDFWRWSRQALGMPGLFLGWSSMLQRKVQSQAAKSLTEYEQKKRAS